MTNAKGTTKSQPPGPGGGAVPEHELRTVREIHTLAQRLYGELLTARPWLAASMPQPLTGWERGVPWAP